MNLLPKCHEEFSKADYWNTFFKKRGKKAFEWYGEYPELCGQLSKFIKPKDDVLVVGCGNSTLSMDLYDVGYSNVTSIDISKIVIDQMRDKNRIDRPDLVFEQMDATQTTYSNENFSVVLDKGTLDALMPDTNKDTILRINRFFDEISRVLRRGGRYICISLLQEHILRKIVAYFSSPNYMLRITRCHEAENKTREQEGSAIPVFVIMATKFPGITQKILELSLTDGPPVRISTPEEFINSVLSVQQSALVCDRLQKKSVADVGEVNLDLYIPGNDSPRYTIYVLDRPSTKGKSYAAFLVPQGRDTDWLFGTPEGRRHFLSSVDKDRVAIVILRRDHKFSDWDQVKAELGPSIKNLSPPGLPHNYKIDYLSLGVDVGRREILHEGESKLSGKFVIEDVLDDDEKTRSRRLVFLDNQFVVQSEAKIRSIKTRRGKVKNVVDPGALACEHHAFMSVGVNEILRNKTDAEILVVGLGGGGLCLFLRHCFPMLRVTAVDIDEMMLKIATEWFDFVIDDKMKVVIRDGVKFLEETANGGKKFDAILFDVDSKDSSVGMSCPPQQFLGNCVLNNVSKCLNEDGLFVLNLVCRNKQLRPGVLDDLKRTFVSIASMKMENIVNEILMCSKVTKNDEWTRNWKTSAEHLNEIVKKKKLLNSDVVDVTELLDGLTIES
ncbi:eEF1A lysine and N-terminal methyltransferase homolog [Diachasma alloeum]|uniref:eEF1A lysine and N-terminal methyltransferase homolog n=1 Tax=Diachasma alloeum TaxID=454923 RepID=UPI0007384F3A|nr:eEF1A lysine and N-terminal methyltransferase homolog [Diachasma alloeum]